MAVRRNDPDKAAAADQAAEATATDDQKRAAAKRAAANAGAVVDPNLDRIEALLVERRGYVQRGGERGERGVREVDEQIRFYGGTPPKDDK